MAHVPVLVAEVGAALGPCLRRRAGTRLLDCTVGAGGHSSALLGQSRGCLHSILGLDLDKTALPLAGAAIRTEVAALQQQQGLQLLLAQSSYAAAVPVIHAQHWHDGVDAALMDLGVSSMQLDTPSRGFSFMRDGPLDMRFQQERWGTSSSSSSGNGSESTSHSAAGSSAGSPQLLTAAEIVNTYSERELATIFREYGEEWRGGRRLAKMVVDHRQQHGAIRTTHELLQALGMMVHDGSSNHGAGTNRGSVDAGGGVRRRGEGKKRLAGGRGRSHPATKVFQALRIATNRELEVLRTSLPPVASLLRPGGRLAVISFHSLEDRIVKGTFAELCSTDSELLATGMPGQHGQNHPAAEPRFEIPKEYRKVVLPQREEVKANPRARSAKMRVLQRK